MIKKFFSKKLGAAILAVSLAVSIPQSVHSTNPITSILNSIANSVGENAGPGGIFLRRIITILTHKDEPKKQQELQKNQQNNHRFSSLLFPWNWSVFTWFFKSNPDNVKSKDTKPRSYNISNVKGMEEAYNCAQKKIIDLCKEESDPENGQTLKKFCYNQCPLPKQNPSEVLKGIKNLYLQG